MPNYTPGLTWPRSDGSETSWPTEEERTPSNTETWWEKLPISDEKYTLYETKVGKHIAGKKGVNAAQLRMPLPPGYALFAHHKPQPEGRDRVDVYMKGSSLIGRKYFRSPNEFMPHAEWIFDTSRSIDDHSTCECIYNNDSALARAKKGGGSAAGTPSNKRPAPSGGAPKPKRSKSEAGSEEDEKKSPAVVPERAIDMKTARRFRKGELVWFKIETIIPPAGKPLPSITHWPGLIANIVVKATPVQTGDGNSASASMSAAWAVAGGQAPDSLKAKPKYTYGNDYHIRALGLFSSSNEVTKGAKDILPWALGNELLGGAKGWESLGKEGTRVMREGVQTELRDDKGKSVEPPQDETQLDARWRQKWAQRWSFKDLPKAWDTSVFRLGIAIKIATTITNTWTQTDKIDIVPGADVNHDDMEAIRAQRKTLYQGVWWGGERIWLEDMVRLKKHRAELPVEALGLPTEGAADRAVMMRIRMITIEVSPDATEDQHSWRCLLYGDVYELANASVGAEPTVKIFTDDGIMLHTHAAPKGLVYRQLNEAGSEVTVDIMDVAGRIYPDILDGTTQDWYTDPKLSAEQNQGRVQPGDTAKALAGLKPGTHVGSKSEKWKEDLYSMVSEANKTTERDMSRFYGTLLVPGGVKPKANGVVAAPAANGSH